jgi:Phosphate-selective porin O and P
MTRRRKVGTALALALGLPFLPALAGAEDGMTAPPWGEGPKITFGTDDNGLLAIDYKGQFRGTVLDFGSGASETSTTTNFNFRRNRIALTGAWGEHFSLYVQTEFEDELNLGALGVTSVNQGANFQILDAAMRFDFKPGFKLTVGKFKYNFSRENLEACEQPLTLDRSLFIRAPYVGTRDYGVAIWGNLFKDRFQYRADVMEGRRAISGVVAPQSNPRVSVRGHVTLLDPENGYGYRGTYLGTKKVLTFGGAYQFESKLTYTDPANQLGPKDYKGWTADGFFEYPMKDAGTVTLSGAYEKVDLGGAYQGANPDPGSTGIFGEKNGWYGKAGYLLPKTPLQLFGRFEKWRFACLNNVYDQRIDWWAAGANYYIWGQSLKLTAEFSHTAFDQPGSRDFNTFVTQLQLVF